MEICLDDFHLHSTTQRLHTLVKRPVEGLEGGEPRVTVYNNPGEAGQTVSQILPGASLITLPGTIRATNGSSDQEKLDDYATARQALIDAIKFEYSDSDRILPRTLKITMPNGAQYQATVYRYNWTAPMEWNTHGTWTLELLNPSGVIESQSLTSLNLTLPQPGGVVYPIVYPIVYGASSGGTITATNYGDVDVKPIITLYGPMQNPVITNDTAGKFLRLNMTIDSGRKVVINMGSPSSGRSGQPSIMEGSLDGIPSTNQQGKKATGSSFWTIKPGTNTIRLAATTYDVGHATIEYRSAWSSL